MKSFITAIAALAILIVSAPSTHAGLIDFTSGSITGSSNGNFFQATDDGVTMTLTGWGIGGGAGPTFSEAQIRLWSTGMGNCNQGEGTNCSNPLHTADNAGQLDVFFMTFSQPVFPEMASITAWASDYDVSFWAGTDASFDIDGMTVADLGAQLNSDFGGNATVGVSTRNVDLTEINLDVRWLAFGARVDGDSRDDRFKFKSLAFSVTQVPEPGALALLLAGGLAVGALGRRR